LIAASVKQSLLPTWSAEILAYTLTQRYSLRLVSSVTFPFIRNVFVSVTVSVICVRAAVSYRRCDTAVAVRCRVWRMGVSNCQ